MPNGIVSKITEMILGNRNFTLPSSEKEQHPNISLKIGHFYLPKLVAHREAIAMRQNSFNDLVTILLCRSEIVMTKKNGR